MRFACAETSSVTASATAAQGDYGITTLDWPTLLSTSGQAEELADRPVRDERLDLEERNRA